MALVEDKMVLLKQINLIHTTPLGITRITRNLNLDASIDVVAYCKEQVMSPRCEIQRVGKNWYCSIAEMVITINAYNYTIITAHRVKGKIKV